MPSPQNGQTHSNNLSATAEKNNFSVFDHFVGLAFRGLRVHFPRVLPQVIRVCKNLDKLEELGSSKLGIFQNTPSKFSQTHQMASAAELVKLRIVEAGPSI